MTGSAPDPTLHPTDDRTDPAPATYAGAGVDIEAGERAVDLIKPMVASTLRPEVLGGLGDFGGLFALDTERYRHPVLVAGTDGVGTKALVAQALGRFDTIGIDLVAMCVDDLVCHGAEPLFVLDYISSGAVDPAQMAQLVAGVAEACRGVGASLLGGEMAEHPGVMKPGEFDLVGFAVGVVERAEVLGPARVRPGDTLIGLVSPGLRCNGFTLARHVLLERAGRAFDAPAWPGATVTLADELIRPSVLYTPAVRAAIGAADVHAVAHITGGGFEGNLPRALPPRGCGPCWTGARGRCRPSSVRSDGWAVWPTTRWPGSSTWASGWSWRSARTAPATRWPPSPGPGWTPRWWAGWRTAVTAWSSPGPGGGPTPVPTGRPGRTCRCLRRERGPAAHRVRGAPGPPVGALGQAR